MVRGYILRSQDNAEEYSKHCKLPLLSTSEKERPLIPRKCYPYFPSLPWAESEELQWIMGGPSRFFFSFSCYHWLDTCPRASMKHQCTVVTAPLVYCKATCRISEESVA